MQCECQAVGEQCNSWKWKHIEMSILRNNQLQRRTKASMGSGRFEKLPHIFLDTPYRGGPASRPWYRSQHGTSPAVNTLLISGIQICAFP